MKTLYIFYAKSYVYEGWFIFILLCWFPGAYSVQLYDEIYPNKSSKFQLFVVYTYQPHEWWYAIIEYHLNDITNTDNWYHITHYSYF